MARKSLSIELELDRIRCRDEADGWGDAEPYLWAVYFKIDGSSITVTEDLVLSGSVFTQNTPGSHGNLGTTDVDAGDVVTIPSAIGHFNTTLLPIPVSPPLDVLIEDVGGIVGVVVVLMEEDNVSDDGAEAGHIALNNAVGNALNDIVASRSFDNQDVSDAEIEQFKDDVSDRVSSAIQDNQNIFENIWSWLNADDQIGAEVFMFKQDDLSEGGTISFNKRWRNHGDWEIEGHITSTVLCPAEAINNLFSGLSSIRVMSEKMILDKAERINNKDLSLGSNPHESEKSLNAFNLQIFRDFQKKRLLKNSGLKYWWSLMRMHTPSIVNAVLKNQEVRTNLYSFVKYTEDFVNDLEQKLDDSQFENLNMLIHNLIKLSKNRRFVLDLSRIRDIVPLIRHRKGREIVEVLKSNLPVRKKKTAAE